MNHVSTIRPQKLHLEFVHLWTKSSRRIHAYLLALSMSWSEAEDLLQEVASTAWEKFPEFDQSRDFVTWANGIARNKALSARRKQGDCAMLGDLRESGNGVSGVVIIRCDEPSACRKEVPRWRAGRPFILQITLRS